MPPSNSVLPILLTTGGIVSGVYFFLPNKAAKTGLEAYRYHVLPLLSSTPCAQDHRSLCIAIPSSKKNLFAEPLRISSVYLKEPALQIERAYTPLYDTLPGSSTPGNEVELIIKRYVDGELGRFAHRLKVGEEVPVRGPVETWKCQGKRPQEVVLLVGGTGLTPAFQLINNAKDTQTRFTLLYATKSLGSAILLPQLHEMVGEKVKVAVFVDEMEGDPGLEVQQSRKGWFTSSSGPDATLSKASSDVQIPLFHSRITQSHIPPPKDGRIVLVCGPEAMVQVLSGPKSRDGLSQGPLLGLLAQSGYTSSQVVKL